MMMMIMMIIMMMNESRSVYFQNSETDIIFVNCTKWLTKFFFVDVLAGQHRFDALEVARQESVVRLLQLRVLGWDKRTQPIDLIFDHPRYVQLQSRLLTDWKRNIRKTTKIQDWYFSIAIKQDTASVWQVYIHCNLIIKWLFITQIFVIRRLRLGSHCLYYNIDNTHTYSYVPVFNSIK